MRVEIWSDVACPWCYVGKRNFEAALGRFAWRDQVKVVWRSFELDAAAPPERHGRYADRLAEKYRTSVAEAEAMIDRMVRAGSKVGLELRFDIARPGNTFDAHRVIHLGAARGLQDAVKERLLAANFVEGRPVGDRETLLELAVEAGLGREDVRAVLHSDAFAAAVRADEAEAAALEITAVPFFVVDRTYGLAGAHPPEVLVEMLERAWDEAPAPVAAEDQVGAAAVCQGEACDV